MRIIISPAKKMIVDSDDLGHRHIPKFIQDVEVLLTYLRGLNYEEVKSIWKCSDKIAELNYKRIRKMDLYKNLTPAILSYEGIQYQYMAPGVFEEEELEYIDEHLRILSGFYGILRPFDGVVPYRLEMQTKLINWNFNSLYEFWHEKLAEQLFTESQYIVNLASKEYSKCISNYLDKNVKFVTCTFGELINEKVVEKGTFVKMARGEMVRFMAENRVKNIDDIKTFNRLNYIFSNELSNENTYVFIKNNNGK